MRDHGQDGMMEQMGMKSLPKTKSPEDVSASGKLAEVARFRRNSAVEVRWSKWT
jgi:hypothetical protein